jgi:hypothetical protein
MKFIRELFHTLLESLDNANRAIVEGKALDELKERLGGLYRVKEVVPNKVRRLADKMEINLLVAGDISPDEMLEIRTESIKVNMKYANILRIRVIVDDCRPRLSS